MHKMHKD